MPVSVVTSEHLRIIKLISGAFIIAPVVGGPNGYAVAYPYLLEREGDGWKLG